MAKRRLAVEIVGDADKLDKAYKQGADGADRFEKQTSSSFDKAGKSSDTFGQKMSGLRDKADGWGKGIAIGIGAGAGALAAGLFVKGFSDALDKESGQAMLGIQLGLPPEMAKAAGQLSGEVYASGFGESLEESNQAVRFITQNMGGLGDVTKDEMKDMTKGVLTLSKAFDEDLNSVTATAGTLIKTGLAKDGKEALDILTRGLSSPANKAGDLLDTFTEYSTQFRQLGLTAPMALGLMSQGLAAGARDADTVADALKEFAIRAQDGSTTSRDAFAAIGLNADEMAQKIAAGGPAAQEALQLTFDKLRAIEDPALRAQIATGLFGTKAEDLQAALFALDPSTAVAGIGSVEGAMNRATDATNTNQAKVEEWRRSMEENVSNFIALSVIPWFDTMGQRLEDIGNQWDTGRGKVGDFHAGMMTLGDGFIWLKDNAIDPTVGSLQTLFGWIGDTIEKVENLWSKLTGGGNQGASGLLGLALGGLPGGVLGLLAGSFDTGGVVPGRKGSPKIILAHGGETILPTHQMSFPMAVTSIAEDQPGWDPWTMGNGLGPGGRTYEQFMADEWAGASHAALGWSAADTAAVQGLIDAGYTGAPTSGMPGTTINNFYGPVTGEQDFIQRIRSGNYQAARTGRSF